MPERKTGCFRPPSTPGIIRAWRAERMALERRLDLRLTGHRERRSAGTAGRPRPGGRSGVRLTDVLSTADHLNQSIPERHEVEGAGPPAGRRGAGQRLATAGSGSHRTASGSGAPGPAPGLATTVDTVQAVLSRRHTPGTADWSLAEDDHAAAVQEYADRSIPPPRRSPRGPSGASDPVRADRPPGPTTASPADDRLGAGRRPRSPRPVAVSGPGGRLRAGRP